MKGRRGESPSGAPCPSLAMGAASVPLSQNRSEGHALTLSEDHHLHLVARLVGSESVGVGIEVRDLGVPELDEDVASAELDDEP